MGIVCFEQPSFMDPIHGKHHKGRITYQHYKQVDESPFHSFVANTRMAVSTIITICSPKRILYYERRQISMSYLPPFTLICNRKVATCNISFLHYLKAHIRGKKHAARLIEKSEIISHNDDEMIQEESVPGTSMAMPSLLYRTNAIKKRVIESNHVENSPIATSKTPPQSTPPSEKPEWMKKSK